MTDIESIASRLTPNMVRALTWWCHEGVIHRDVEDATKRGLVTRGLAVWGSGQCLNLNEVGEQVRAVLMERKGAA